MAPRTHTKAQTDPEASADTDSETQVEAGAEETQPAPEPADTADDGKRTIVTKVWARAGQIPKASVLQTAIQSVRNSIPVVFELNAEITGATKTHQDKDKGTEDGTEFEVTVTYTPRAVTGGKEEPVDVDKVIKGLDVPRSFDGIGGHDGDPDFHDRKPTEF
ncbi:hypothetical protein [Mycobacterium intracellulare]|uniref:hypothetical protein n=1 Tax=Mycobacterium intracellulare TaxID=1767 RepID=UPI000CE3D955|nr:hypothetical protein [Mycobacterium intracellulare]